MNRHLLTLLPVFSDTLLLGHLHTVLDVFAVLLGDVFAALGVGGLALLTRHRLTNKRRVLRVLTNERRVLRVLTNERRVLPDTAAHSWLNNAPLEYPEKRGKLVSLHWPKSSKCHIFCLFQPKSEVTF